MENSEMKIGKLAEALCKVQGEITGAVTDSDNPFFKSKYADLTSVWGACRKALTKHGLAVIQTTDVLPSGGACLCTTLAHSSGEYITGRYPLMPQKQDPQAWGSALTYARRYCLAAIVGVAPVGDDDDAEAAMHRDQSAPQPQPKSAPQPQPEFDTPDGFMDLAGFRIDVGKKFKGKTLGEIPMDELRSFTEWARRAKSQSGKLLADYPDWGEFIRNASIFLDGVS